MAKKEAANQRIVSSSTLDFGTTFRRWNRKPIDDSSVFLTYDALEEEMKSANSAIYKGQIVAVLGEGQDKASFPEAIYEIRNDEGLPTTYYADRIISLSYLDETLKDKYVLQTELGTRYTGVGQWYDAWDEENHTFKTNLSYGEIFNDYWENEASGEYSTASGWATQAKNKREFTIGAYSLSYTYEDTGKNTLFTIGDGVDADHRHNLMDIRQNGQMYYNGAATISGNVIAPVSYSYVESLGPTAYLTTILSALLTQPEYTKPTINVTFTGTGTFEVGSKVSTTAKFNLSNVTTNPSSLLHGNCAGLSTGAYLINYAYNAGDAGNKSMNIDTAGKYEKLIVGQWSTKTASSDTVKLGDFTDVTEGTYNIFGKLGSTPNKYYFYGASQMYFEQLMAKGIYVEANGISPKEKFGDMSVEYGNTASFNVQYKFYYKQDATNSAPTWSNSNYKDGSNPFSGWTQGWCNKSAAVNSTQQTNDISTSGSNYRFWIAIPENCELEHYGGVVNSSLYVYYRDKMGNEQSLDSGMSTANPFPTNPMYVFNTTFTVNNCHLKYNIYCVHVPGKIGQGNIRFKFKRIK